jgi:hypothetical protein
MRSELATAITGKRFLLLAVADLLTAAAALAIGILLFGDFGSTEGRILATTALLAGYGLFALPAAILRDQRRLAALTIAVVALAVAGASLTILAIWTGEPPDVLGRSIGTVNGWLVAAAQVAAVALRRRTHDPGIVRRLFAASSTLIVLLAAMLTALLWAGIDSERYGRAFGALVVLNVLLVALQPLLARMHPSETVHRLRVRVAPDKAVELIVEAPDLAAAASKAIRKLERDGRRILALEFIDRAAECGTAAHGEGAAGGPARRARTPPETLPPR